MEKESKTYRELFDLMQSLQEIPLVELENKTQELQAELTNADFNGLIADLEGYAQKMIRIATYMESIYEGMGHDKAVKEQNKKIAKVRKALGYTYPKREIQF